MHRIARNDLEAAIFVSIQCAPKTMKQRVERDGGLAGERAFKELAKHICDQIDNQSHMVIRTELVGYAMGKWDIDEPSPAELIKLPMR
ncbi:hypothetical protein [Sphingobium boeckii]|uniref:Uncharacterized protein n=1 Tax=Sphingobium boeckii TaxID=1082345 RepID=A0A7W9AG73_9SPHN|nr:hypothetical protein [Sphingobium boeckii]MBB5685003.1 hypothetical protein [Sphingobium boeckii]